MSSQETKKFSRTKSKKNHRSRSKAKISSSKSSKKPINSIRKSVHKHRSHRHRHHKKEPINVDLDIGLMDEQEPREEPETNHTDQTEPKVELGDKTKARLKSKINDWLDFDDKIKALNAQMKKYKDAKKQQEDVILKMISRIDNDDLKIDIEGDNNEIRGRVYRHKSVTKGALKEDIIKAALMESFRNEKKVDQLVKKIVSMRPMNERYYLKRTKGTKDK